MTDEYMGTLDSKARRAQRRRETKKADKYTRNLEKALESAYKPSEGHRDFAYIPDDETMPCVRCNKSHNCTTPCTSYREWTDEYDY